MQQRQREEQQIVRDTSNWRQVTAATATWVSVGGEGVGDGDESQSLVAVAVVVGFATCPGTSRMTKMTTTTASAAAKTHRQVIKIITLCPKDAAAAAGGNNAHTRCAFYGPKPSPDLRPPTVFSSVALRYYCYDYCNMFCVGLLYNLLPLLSDRADKNHNMAQFGDVKGPKRNPRRNNNVYWAV